MKQSSLFLIIFSVIALFALLWIGCSDKTTITSDIAETEATLTEYFPLKSGISNQFMEINHVISDTTYRWFTMGQTVNVGGCTIYPWFENSAKPYATTDTGYIYCQGEALYYFEASDEIPEKLLQLPLTAGNSWLRYDASQSRTGDDNIINILHDSEESGQDGDGAFGAHEGTGDEGSGTHVSKSFPTIGSNYFKIIAVEDIVLDNGNSFKQCLRIENTISDATNQYWYAPRMGLVRYILGIDYDSYPDGEMSGEIVFGR